MGFPLADWQFWTVTVAAVGAVWLLVEPFVGGAGKKTGGPCSQCGVAAGAPCGDDSPRDRLVVLGKPR
jgi:hypothetical protein